MNLYYRTLETSYWSVEAGNLVRRGILRSNTEFYLIDPTTINSLGGDKQTALTPSRLQRFLRIAATAPDLVIPNASNFLVSQWNLLGWDVDGDLSGDCAFWSNTNFDQQALGYSFSETNLLILKGIVGGNSYAMGLVQVGNRALESLPVDGGGFTNATFHSTLDGGGFVDETFDVTIDGGTF